MRLANIARREFNLFALLLASLLAPAVIRAKDSPTTESVAMSDGVKLATDVYLPETGQSPFPAILIRTPYGKGGIKGIAAGLTAVGYAVVAQDMRGRFDSGGHHAIIFANDGATGAHHDG